MYLPAACRAQHGASPWGIRRVRADFKTEDTNFRGWILHSSQGKYDARNQRAEVLRGTNQAESSSRGDMDAAVESGGGGAAGQTVCGEGNSLASWVKL